MSCRVAAVRMPRRFPRDVAERRLRGMVKLAAVTGRNIKWLSGEEFVVVDWSRHARAVSYTHLTLPTTERV